MTPTTWEAALRAWVVSASGYAEGKVYFAGQDAPQPAPPCISLRVISRRRRGQDWLDAGDNPDSTGSDGEEVLLTARGPRRGVLRVQCFAVDAVGSDGATEVLERCQTKAILPSIYAALADAGVALLDFAAVGATGAQQNTTHFEPRAVMDVTFSYSAEAIETTTYIETADVSGEVADG